MLDDYLEKKRQELGLERYDTLQKVQSWLEEQYPGQARAISLNKGVLRLVTSSAGVASNLRFQSAAIMAVSPSDITRVTVQIRQK